MSELMVLKLDEFLIYFYCYGLCFLSQRIIFNVFCYSEESTLPKATFALHSSLSVVVAIVSDDINTLVFGPKNRQNRPGQH